MLSTVFRLCGRRPYALVVAVVVTLFVVTAVALSWHGAGAEVAMGTMLVGIATLVATAIGLACAGASPTAVKRVQRRQRPVTPAPRAPTVMTVDRDAQLEAQVAAMRQEIEFLRDRVAAMGTDSALD